ncbi:hypothetical protein [Tautonia sociabilis]|uniref:Uncharacterized protein n=1 Tax=Tautonia sociabilis TaxID=2080755 RepID=A0A432MJ95_9BACT|nr:hypothetical protein [Tautonia sociabilis]RUL87442.1 hypothetical protein TsocGM_12230 [Tautonia sociabilis]
MRPIAILLLIPLLVLCPIACGVWGPACAPDLLGAQPDGTGHSDRGPDRDCVPGPVGIPQDADDCLCKGAIQLDGPRGHDGDQANLLPALDSPPSDHRPSLSHLLSHRGWAGSPTGWASRLGAIRVRAVLQNFRC